MLKRIDRILLRVTGVESAARFYQEVMGLKLVKHDRRVALLQFAGDSAQLLLHNDEDLPAEAVSYLVDDVRDLYKRRDAMKLTFVQSPAPAARGYRAAVRDPFGNVLLIVDRTLEAAGGGAAIEDAKGPTALFPGIEEKLPTRASALVAAYELVGITADDLPYTPHFERLFDRYCGAFGLGKPSRAEVWRQLLNLRKSVRLPRLGPARSMPPEVSDGDKARLRKMLGKDIGKRDRLPYTERFDKLVDEFNRGRRPAISPHLVWRLVATLAK